jgi:protein subunit release factor A
MGDVEEANLLLAEAEAADCEAERIRSTYNFNAEDISNLRNDLVSMDLVSILDQKQLEKLAVSSSV